MSNEWRAFIFELRVTALAAVGNPCKTICPRLTLFSCSLGSRLGADLVPSGTLNHTRIVRIDMVLVTNLLLLLRNLS